MEKKSTTQKLMTNWRWWMVVLLFVATTVNYLDRQVLSLTWKDFIAPEFHWTDNDYGTITAIFSIVYAICMLFAGKFVDWMGTKKGYLWSIGIWSAGACLHAICGWLTIHIEGYESAAAMTAVQAGSTAALAIASTSVWLFLAARCILALGEAGNFPAAIKVTAEYFPKKDRAFATSIFNSGASIGALIAPATIPVLAQFFKDKGVGGGWEMAFVIIGALGFVWMGFWVFMYNKPEKSKHVNKAELEYILQDDKEEETATTVKEENKEKSINEVGVEMQKNEQSDLKQEDRFFFEPGNIGSVIEEKLSFMPEKEITEETTKQVSLNKNIPDFLKPYVLKSQEEQIRRDNEFIQKRIQAITNYQEKLYKQMNFYEQRRKSQNTSMEALEIYQLTLPYQEACAQEIKRIRALTVEMIYNPKIDLNIPEENIPVYEILEKIIQKKAKLEYVPITKKSYEKRGKASPSLPAQTSILEKNAELEINFDDYINLGDFVHLKNFNVFAYSSPILAEDTRKKPLYNSELPRIVEKVFMESPNQEVIEIHEERERNYYLEQGYKIISVKLVDGYYSINDINPLEKDHERRRI